ncbi:MAG: GAF domain-containing protein [Chloroflexi bacterium]|nr:GAF domain-containing protein [Chloroflexota bacterium]
MKQPQTISMNSTQKYALFGVLFGLLFPVGATIFRVWETGLPMSLSSLLSVQAADKLLWIIDTAPIFLGGFAWLAGYRQNALLRTNEQLLQTEKMLKESQTALELRVTERTTALIIANQNAEKRAEQLQTVAEIARAVITIRNLDELLNQLTRLISERFGHYHIGIFLLDEDGEYALLQASNSEGGARLLARGHRLRVGQQGIVGYVTARGVARIALDVEVESAYFNNPDLPETRSEIALPLKFGQEVIGALDIQSREINAFSQTDVDLLSILADLVSVAIQNARSLEQAQRALHEAEVATNQLTGQAWAGYLETIRTKGYRYDGIKPEPLRKTSRTVDLKDAITVPVQLRGQTIGRFTLKASSEARHWTDDELAIIESTAERVALAMDSARLLNEAQKRAARETFLSELAAKLGASTKLDSILRDTVEELGQNLQGSTVTFQLVNPSNPPAEETMDGAAPSGHSPESA